MNSLACSLAPDSKLHASSMMHIFGVEREPDRYICWLIETIRAKITGLRTAGGNPSSSRVVMSTLGSSMEGLLNTSPYMPSVQNFFSCTAISLMRRSLSSPAISISASLTSSTSAWLPLRSHAVTMASPNTLC
uniref:Uncharacterized protein n=1 Tax=Vibrio harveyi TaxID=669 RepID=E5G5P3_VIBHA|nr:hypothetical protein [Vibrio harveyi]